MAIKRGGEYNRLHSEDAVQAMYDNDKMTGDKDIQLAFWDGLHFGLSDKFTEASLRQIAEDYLRLGIITNKDLTVDEIMDMAWPGRRDAGRIHRCRSCRAGRCCSSCKSKRKSS